MSDMWMDRLEGHGVHGALDSLERAAVDLLDEELDEGAIARVQRCVRASGFVRRLVADADPELTSLAQLDGVRSSAEEIESLLDQFRDSREAEYLTRTDQFVDSMLAHARSSLQMQVTDAELESARDQARSYRASAGQYLRGIREDLDDVKGDLTSLRERIERTEQARGQSIDELDGRLSELGSVIEQQKGRLEQAIQVHQEQFSSAQERRVEQFREMLEDAGGKLSEQLEQAKARSDERFQEQGRTAEELLDDLRETKERIEKVAGAIGASSLAGHHKKYADAEEESANRWRYVTITAAVAVAVLAVVAFFQQREALTWANYAAKLGLALPLAAIATYAGTESSKHRRRARTARDTQLDLLSLGPFLTELDKSAADAIRSVVALRIFGADRQEDDGGEDAVPTGASLAQRGVDAIMNMIVSRNGSG